MGYRRRAGGGKRDLSEKVIVDTLRKLGVRCWYLSGTGNADILTLYGDSYLPLEVKTGKGKRTRNQLDAPWPLVTTFNEAWAAILRAR